MNITLEDEESGFTRTYEFPWPEGKTMIHNAEFADTYVSIAETQFDIDLKEFLRT